MSKNWTMPKWMLPYAQYINNTGGNPIEELVNDDGTNSNVFNNAPRALICCGVKCQVNLLEALHARGMLQLPDTCDACFDYDGAKCTARQPDDLRTTHLPSSEPCNRGIRKGK